MIKCVIYYMGNLVGETELTISQIRFIQSEEGFIVQISTNSRKVS